MLWVLLLEVGGGGKNNSTIFLVEKAPDGQDINSIYFGHFFQKRKCLTYMYLFGGYA